MSTEDHDLTLEEAADAYAAARAKLPAPGQEFHGPEDARNFTACFKAKLALERAACLSATTRTKAVA